MQTQGLGIWVASPPGLAFRVLAVRIDFKCQAKPISPAEGTFVPHFMDDRVLFLWNIDRHGGGITSMPEWRAMNPDVHVCSKGPSSAIDPNGNENLPSVVSRNSCSWRSRVFIVALQRHQQNRKWGSHQDARGRSQLCTRLARLGSV